MVTLNNIRLAFGGQQVLDGVTWQVKPGARIGLIGPNGAGKSTLLKVIAGKQPVDAGIVQYESQTQVGYLSQDTQEIALEMTVLDAALEAFADVLALEEEADAVAHQLEAETDHTTPLYDKLLHRLDDVHTELAAREAHRLRPTAAAVLSGLGFSEEEQQRPLSTFSGGWRMRVVLARMLLQTPNLLLLDEPTNHLDIESIDWLENYLKGYAGTVVVVSHDRYFLDRMVTTTAELVRGQVTEYAGNYAYYLHEREERRTLWRARYENQQKQIKETERFIDRFRSKATKATQVQSRIKQLDKLERVPPPPDDEAVIGFRFPDPPSSGKVVLDLSPFSKAYDDPTVPGGQVRVFDDAGPLTIERGEKIALIGKNGAGKSTLIRMLRGTEAFDGTREEGYRVTMTFFAQNQAEALNPDHTIIEELSATAIGRSETEIRSLAGAFLFTGDDIFKPIGVLSGGEKSRVALAKTLLTPANFLLLDEPTNHLDIASTNVLIEAMRQYTGTFVVVSHDRHFLDQVAQKIWHAEGGEVREYPGTYTAYRWKMEQEAARANDASTASAAAAPVASSDNGSGPKSKAQKRLEAQARREARAGKNGIAALNDFKLRSAFQDAEKAIARHEAEQETLQARLNDPALYADHEAAAAVTQRIHDLKQALQELYPKWEELAEEMAERELV